MNKLSLRTGIALTACLWMQTTHAGLFDDDEARRAILDLRTRVEEQRQQQGQANKQLTEQVQQLQRSLLELNNQNEQLRSELAKHQGQIEQLSRDVSELQRRQKDIAQGVDDRMRKLEPQPVTLDGRQFMVEADEKRAYEDAMALLRQSDFDKATSALTSFLKRYSSSGYVDAVRYWLGNAQYGRRDYREAISTFRAFIAGAPDHPRVPEAWLAIANCQAEMKDHRQARKTLEELIKTYPKSEAAQAARERLPTLK